MNYAPLLVGLGAALLLAIAFAGGALLGHFLTGRRRYDEGQRAGYSEGYAAMKAEHEAYRHKNRAALAAIQALTPDAPVASLGPSLASPTFDTSGAYDCHVETSRGRQAVGRGRSLDEARAVAKRVLERTQHPEVVITKPGTDGRRAEVERVRSLRHGDGTIAGVEHSARMTPEVAQLIAAGEHIPPRPEPDRCGALFGFRGTTAHCALPAGHVGEHDLTPDA